MIIKSLNSLSLFNKVVVAYSAQYSWPMDSRYSFGSSGLLGQSGSAETIKEKNLKRSRIQSEHRHVHIIKDRIWQLYT